MNKSDMYSIANGQTETMVSRQNQRNQKVLPFSRSSPSSTSTFGAVALTAAGAMAAGRTALVRRRATAVKKKGVRVVEGKE